MLGLTDFCAFMGAGALLCGIVFLDAILLACGAGLLLAAASIGCCYCFFSSKPSGEPVIADNNPVAGQQPSLL